MLFQCFIILNSLSIKKISDFIVKLFFAALLLQKMCNETKWRYIKNFESNQVEKEIVLYLNIKEDKIDELERYKIVNKWDVYVFYSWCFVHENRNMSNRQPDNSGRRR